MTARAAAAGSSARASCTDLARIALFLIACAAAAPATAQVGLSASLVSDARFRGYSLSEGRPVASFDFAYDASSGLYLGGSLSGVLLRDGEPAPFGVQVDAGYARRVSSGTTLDFGITHSNYSHYSGRQRGTSYTELFAGIARGGLSSRIFVSPHYFLPGRWTAYGEVDGHVSPADDWSIDGHVGALVDLRTPAHGPVNRPGVDWSAGVTRQLGRVALHASWSDGAPGRDFYNRRHHSRSALVFGASMPL